MTQLLALQAEEVGLPDDNRGRLLSTHLEVSCEAPADSSAGARTEGLALQPLLTIGEVAALLRVCDKTVQRLVATRRMSCVRIGRRIRFVPADVFRFVAARKD